MISAITNGIKVSVVTEYQPIYSQPSQGQYAFSYTIAIDNTTEITVKLISRRWNIFDSFGASYEVKGSGVIGLTPTIEPGERFEYTSGCNFATTIGRMRGVYLMQRVRDDKLFEIEIPEFILEVPWILN
jgi:ApaG protein